MGGLHICMHSCVLYNEEYVIPHSLVNEPYERDDILKKRPIILHICIHSHECFALKSTSYLMKAYQRDVIFMSMGLLHVVGSLKL